VKLSNALPGPHLQCLTLLSLLGIAFGLQTEGGHAAPLVTANAEAAYLGSETPAQTATSGSVMDVDSGNGEFGEPRSGDNMAFGSFGVLRASSSVSVLPRSSSSPYAAFGTSTASFQDDFLIDAPGLTGTAGTVTVRFTIDGSLSLEKYGSAAYSASQSSTYAQATYAIGVGIGATDVTASQRLRYDGSTSGTPFLGVEQQYVLNFIFGTTVNDFTLRITTSAAAAGEGSTYLSTATADLSHTAVWGGFVEVRDSNNNVVNGYSFSSSSGADFTQPIPEPTSATLVALAGTALLGRRRLRKNAGTGSKA